MIHSLFHCYTCKHFYPGLRWEQTACFQAPSDCVWSWARQVPSERSWELLLKNWLFFYFSPVSWYDRLSRVGDKLVLDFLQLVDWLGLGKDHRGVPVRLQNKRECRVPPIIPYGGHREKVFVFFLALPLLEGRGEGLAMPEFFGPFSRRAYLVNKRSLFLLTFNCLGCL